MVHKEYPPFLAVFEYFWCVLSGGFNETNVTMGIHIFEFGTIVPFIAEINKNKENTAIEKMLMLIFTLFAVSAVVLMFDGECVFNTICSDIAVSLIYVYMLITADNAKNGDKFHYFSLVFSAICFANVKQISIPFILLVWLFFTIKEFTEKSNIKKTKYKLLKSVCLLILPFISYVVWNVYTKKLGLVGQFDLNKIDFPVAVRECFGVVPTLRSQVAIKVVNAFLTMPISTGIIRISYIGASVLAAVILYVICKCMYDRKTFFKYLTVFIVGTTGYAFTLLVLYLFCFSETEMLQLAGYTRYTGTYIVSEYLVLLYLLIKKANIMGKEAKVVYITIVGISILLSDSNYFGAFNMQCLYGEPMEEYRIRAGRIESHVEEGSEIFLIGGENLKNGYFTNFYLNNVMIDPNTENGEIFNHGTDEDDFWNKILEYIARDDYLYVRNTNETADKIIGKYTAEKVLNEETLYKVEYDGTYLSLVPCE